LEISRDEPVSQTTNRPDGVPANLASQSADVDFKGIGFAFLGHGIEMIEDFAMRKHLSGTVEEELEQAELDLSKIDLSALNPCSFGLLIKFDATRHQADFDLSGSPPEQSVQTGDKLLGPDRLDNVVIGTSIQTFDFFLPAAARSQNQHRYRESGSAQLANELYPIHTRQADINDESRKRQDIRHFERLFGARRVFYHEAIWGKSGNQPRSKVAIILD
jgi:hypothetical protein